MSSECKVSVGERMILSCSGGSNVGQLSNRAAVELTQEGFGKMFCLAGIGGHLEGFLKKAREASQILAIDGCEIGCTKAILDHAAIPATSHVVLTGLGIEKNKDLDLKREEIDRVKETVKTASSSPDGMNAPASSKTSPCSCGG